MSTQFKDLDKIAPKLYCNSIQNVIGGRYPFSNDISARNQYALTVNGIVAFKALKGGRSSVSRGAGALTDYNVDIPAALFNIHRKGELNNRGLVMSSHFPRDISLNLIHASCTLHFLSLLFTQGEKARPITLDISASDGLACVLRHVENQIRQALEEIDSYVNLPEGDVK